MKVSYNGVRLTTTMFREPEPGGPRFGYSPCIDG